MKTVHANAQQLDPREQHYWIESNRYWAAQQRKGGQTMNASQEKEKIHGYDYGTDKVAKSPITMKEWEELKKSALFSEEDVVYLRLSEGVLADQVDDLLKTWRGIIFDHPHLRGYDEDPKTHAVDTDYAKAVGKRFGQWVLDTARAQYNQSGSTISTKLACAITAARRIKRTTAIRSVIFVPATCSPFARRLSFR